MLKGSTNGIISGICSGSLDIIPITSKKLSLPAN
jgi:hypothetical protein